MQNRVIDLRKLRKALKGGVDPENELPARPEEKLLEAARSDSAEPRREAAAHPVGFGADVQSSRVLLGWEALEFEPDAGQNLLKLGLGGLLLIGAAVAFILRSHLFGILLLVAGAVVVSYAFRAPRSLSLAITSRGVKIAKRIYEFRDLKSFWIVYDPPLSRDLILESKKTLMPTIRIPLGDTDPLQIREVLLRFLPEVEREESLLDVISKRLGF